MGCGLPVPGLGYAFVPFSSLSLRNLIKKKEIEIPKPENLSLEGGKCESMGLVKTESSASFVVPNKQEVVDGWEVDGLMNGSAHRWTERSMVDYV